ncbi:shikimate kinase [Ruficoccus sp. ZRK36]|uniref:shikimate kinase n=1 Tax=Ruficoccus sp. ZRK36 TaxID=2866311 RepID=UPI001C72D443|nr:shikimate kinase [Ruficoccus sp. ZRK36]QYY36844.1 shikimate kinase [Ruficoccus sp. ZRK36]
MSRPAKTPRPNLYLVGFMGTGKTTVGRALARRLRLKFIDSDHVIEEQAGKPIPQIFAEEGEAHFRALEKAFVESGHPACGCIVACGGGLVTQPGMAEALRERGIVVSLFASPATILKRTSSNSNRPLLNVPDPEGRIRELLAEREPAYLRAGMSIYTDERPMSDVVSHLERFYRREARA